MKPLRSNTDPRLCMGQRAREKDEAKAKLLVKSLHALSLLFLLIPSTKIFQLLYKPVAPKNSLQENFSFWAMGTKSGWLQFNAALIYFVTDVRNRLSAKSRRKLFLFWAKYQLMGRTLWVVVLVACYCKVKLSHCRTDVRKHVAVKIVIQLINLTGNQEIWQLMRLDLASWQSGGSGCKVFTETAKRLHTVSKVAEIFHNSSKCSKIHK